MGNNELIWEEWRILPNSSVGTNFEAIDLIAMNEVPLKISTIEPEKNEFAEKYLQISPYVC